MTTGRDYDRVIQEAEQVGLKIWSFNHSYSPNFLGLHQDLGVFASVAECGAD